MDMDDRKLKILQAIVHSYLSFGEPVGSRTISKYYDLGISPATIRNEMSDLEELGLLLKTHTSSGRVPSEQALRLYVDRMINLDSIAKAEREAIRKSVIKEIKEVEDLVKNGAKVLSELTHYTSIAMIPRLRTSKLSHIRLVPVTSKRALLVIVDQKGLVDNTLVEFEHEIDETQLIILSNLISDQLQYKTFGQILSEATMIEELHSPQNKEVFRKISQYLSQKEENRLIYNGLSYLLNDVNQEDISKAKNVLEFLDNEENLRSLLLQDQESGLVIRIGSENLVEEMKECSLITASYHMDGYHLEKIGIIGPTRLQYSRVIPLIKSIAFEMSKWFEENET